MIIEYLERLRRLPLPERREAVQFLTWTIVAVIVVIYGIYFLIKSFMVPAIVSPTQPGLTPPFEQSP